MNLYSWGLICQTDLDYTEGEVLRDDVPLQSYGSIDANGHEVINEDLTAHAVSDSINIPVPESFGEEHFKVKRGSHFISEYGRKQDDGTRTDGGPANPNHLLEHSLFFFRMVSGGLKTARCIDVPYEVHARWALQFGDRRFRRDLHFVFQVFGVIQKRNICRSSVLQMTTSSYIHHQPLLSTVKPKDLVKAAKEEKQKSPLHQSGSIGFTHPTVSCAS